MLHGFMYVAPSSKKELLELISEKSGSYKILAGGTDLLVDIRAGKISPSCVIDIKKIEDFKEINFSLEEGLIIGASVTLTEITENGFVNSDFEVLANAAASIASRQIRNKATVAGNICTASPAGDMAPALLALDARVNVISVRGRRTELLSSFYKGVRKTDLADDEIVESISVPNKYSDWKGKVLKLKRIKGHDLALVSAAMISDSDVIRLAAGSCAPVPVFLGEYKISSDVEHIVDSALKLTSPIDDLRAGAEYRKFMLGQYIKRLVEYARTSDEE